jgi:hypothetical protein
MVAIKWEREDKACSERKNLLTARDRVACLL